MQYIIAIRTTTFVKIKFNVILGGKFESVLNDSVYKVDMVLNIKSVGPADFGSYKCVAKNSLGETDGTIKLYSKFNDDSL